MSDTTVIKVTSETAPIGEMGQKHLALSKKLSMRLWENEQPNDAKPMTQRPYEAIGYVINGRAELHLEGQMILLEPGNSWVVPEGASHTYKILEPFTAVEVTTPPAEVHGRDRA
ncbi:MULTISPECIES: cupin domain-containing protein [unclassified Leptolyngbya]|uniref:cupin domain-containing protein n=1 Tax=unclassified Leptolyngbya TaxID=2650499 RepID=UPI00168A09AB|nr:MULTISPECIES: cupin domain-containing protein [unclassified Leptolyngbya]MBD1909375.1 cupin domain-containing protein [Leptolyngbya sp. FACHB-8]MBD2157610.1 cupin domain-containing protein [Leptolyngbya sp. FACHB-16]